MANLLFLIITIIILFSLFLDTIILCVLVFITLDLF